MKRLFLTMAGVGLLGAFFVRAAADEGKAEARKVTREDVTIDKVPPAVKETLLKEAGKNTIEDISLVTRGDYQRYEAEWGTEDDKEIEINVSPEGTVLEKEVVVRIADVPAAVKATILKEAGDNPIDEIEEVIVPDGKFYEAEWDAGEKEFEIQVSADGKLISKEVEE